MSNETPASELLTTLILYIRFQNLKTVARMLVTSPGTVWARLEGLPVKTRLTGDHETDVVELNGIEYLVGLVKQLEADGGQLDLGELAGQYWTPDEDRLLGSSTSDEMLAVLLGRSVQAVRFRRKGGGPGQGSNQRRWTDAENAFVLGSLLTVAEIAAELGRTTAATQKHRDRLRHQAQGLWGDCRIWAPFVGPGPAADY